MSDNMGGLRPAPRDPMVYIIVGVVLAAVGAIPTAIWDDGAVFGLLVALGALVALVGVIGQGVLLGVRAANYESYLNGLIDDAED